MSRLVLVDDDEPLLETLACDLRARGHAVRTFIEPTDALAAIRSEHADVAIVDLELGGITGVTLCERLRSQRPDIPVIVLTAFGSFDTAVAAMRAGAYDFLSKPIRLDTLSDTVERAAAHVASSVRARRLEEDVDLAEMQADDGFVCASRSMREILDLAHRVATSEATVLISGESGTGKEVIARRVHQASRRSAGPFVALNCAAVSESLLESELFGHTRGAFTDARTNHEGLLVAATGGTLFLDEVGEMPLALQPKLLRALQERVVRPVGASAEIPLDVRLIAATNRNLERAVEQRSFRADLFYRLDVVQLVIPPLRTRTDDILPLAMTFIASFRATTGKKVMGMLPATTERLLAYPWPGNVRELQNCIEHAVALTKLDRLAPCDLPEKVAEHRTVARPATGDVDREEVAPLDEVERRHVHQALTSFGGNKSAAARALGIDRKRLYRLLARLGHGED